MAYNMLHKMRAQLTLAVQQQYQARQCHDQAVAAYERGLMREAAELQICAAHHADCATSHMAAARPETSLMRVGVAATRRRPPGY